MKPPRRMQVQFNPNLRGIAGRNNEIRQARPSGHGPKPRCNRDRHHCAGLRGWLLRGQQNPEADRCCPDAARGRRRYDDEAVNTP